MQKHLLKNDVKLGIFLFGIFFFFINCDKDTTQHEVDTKQKVQSIIQRVSFAEMQQNSVLSEKLNLIKNKKKTAVDGKLVYSNAFHFYIETDEAIYIESEDGLTHAYTFAIIRNERTTELENLVLYLQEDGTYAMKIVTYHYTEQDRLDQANGLPVDLTDKVSYQTINDEGVITSIFSLEVGCITVYFDYCGENVSAHAENLSQCDAVETDYLEFGDCSGGGYTGMSDPSGSSNTQTGGNQGGGSGIGTSPIEPPVEPSTEEKIEMCFGQLSDTNTVIELTATQSTWLFDGFGVKYKDDVLSFLENNSCSNEAKQFVKDAVDALMNNGEVDFDKEIIYDIPDDCQRKIVKEAFNNTSALTTAVKNVFTGTNTDYFYKIDQSVIPPAQNGGFSAAGTIPLPNCVAGDCTFTTTLHTYLLSGDPNNPNWEGATDLSIAKTVIHESLHALLSYMLYNGALSASPNPTYVELAEAYALYQADATGATGQALNDLQHDYMVDFIDDVAIALEQVGQNLGYNNPFDYYQKLAWSGSMQSSTAYPMNFDFNQQGEIEAMGAAELFNETQYFTGTSGMIVAIPKGNLANDTNSNCD